MPDLIRIATSGLISHQGALNTTGHNITNANVEGYSRQRTNLETLAPQALNGVYFGSGVEIQSVQRIVDNFAIEQMRLTNTSFEESDTLRFWSEQVDSLFSEDAAGLSTRIDSLYNTIQDASTNPSFIPNRELVLAEAKALTEQFDYVHGQLSEINRSLNDNLNALATDISTLASSIADLNLQIEASTSTDGFNSPNDLLDQRDRLIQELSGIVDIQVVNDGTALNVFVGKGQALIVGTQFTKVETTPDIFDPTKLELALVGNSAKKIFTNSTTGGKVGGIMTFRDELLDQAFNELGQLALSVTGDLNRQNQLGYTLNDELGGLIFSDPNADGIADLRARPSAINDPATDLDLLIYIDDSSALTTSDYRLDYDGANWSLIRLSDGDTTALVDNGAGAFETTGGDSAVDGISISFIPAPPATPTVAAGDKFYIQPTRLGALNLGMTATRAEDLAFAAPVRANDQLGNLGNGHAVVTDVFENTQIGGSGTLVTPVTVTFTSATTYNVVNGSGTTIVTGATYVPGVSNQLFASDAAGATATKPYLGFQVELDGRPESGDDFTVLLNTGAVSDNFNALKMASLQTELRVGNGDSTYQGAFTNMTSRAGTITRTARINAESDQTLLNQAKENRENISGVNLDEEAANLIRFEQAYNASAQVISVARNIIDTLFQAVG